jgi:TP901 family phage tail tape measure protein
MQELGITAYDTAGHFVGITALAGQLQHKLSGLTQAQRDQALAQIFGSDATRAASVLYNEGAAGIQNYIDVGQRQRRGGPYRGPEDEQPGRRRGAAQRHPGDPGDHVR